MFEFSTRRRVCMPNVSVKTSHEKVPNQRWSGQVRSGQAIVESFETST